MGRPTLVSLAKELGVSRQTVSNVLNSPHLVKPETRDRVRKAIEASGYRPNQAAQALRKQKSGTLAMRIYPSSDGIYGAVMDRFLHRLVSEARARSYNIMPITAIDDRDELQQLCALYDKGSIDGCLLSGTSEHDERPRVLAQRQIPVVTFGRPWGDDELSHYWVDVDGAGATAAATRDFLARGHERIGFVGMEAGSGPGDDRRRGWQEAMTQAQPHVDLSQMDTHGVDSIETGVSAARELVARGATAFVCPSDSLAFGALVHLRNAFPDSYQTMPVIGFDDSPVARALGMSSVGQPVEMAVHLLVEAIIEQLKDPEGTLPEPVLLQGSVTMREPVMPVSPAQE